MWRIISSVLNSYRDGKKSSSHYIREGKPISKEPPTNFSLALLCIVFPSTDVSVLSMENSSLVMFELLIQDCGKIIGNLFSLRFYFLISIEHTKEFKAITTKNNKKGPKFCRFILVNYCREHHFENKRKYDIWKLDFVKNILLLSRIFHLPAIRPLV